MVLISFYFSVYIIHDIAPATAFFRTTSIFALGFVYEFYNIFRSKALYCMRILSEAAIGIVIGFITMIICFINITTENTPPINVTDRQILLYFSAYYVCIVGMETGISGFLFLAKKKAELEEIDKNYQEPLEARER